MITTDILIEQSFGTCHCPLQAIVFPESLAIVSGKVNDQQVEESLSNLTGSTSQLNVLLEESG